MKIRAWLCMLMAGIGACSGELPHDSEYDPNSPLSKQAKGTLVGRISLEGESDFSQVTVQLQNESRTYSVDTDANGEVWLTGVVPGSYGLSVRTRYFEAVSQAVQVSLGEQVDIGAHVLAPLRATVFGSAVVEEIDGAAGAPAVAAAPAVPPQMPTTLAGGVAIELVQVQTPRGNPVAEIEEGLEEKEGGRDTDDKDPAREDTAVADGEPKAPERQVFKTVSNADGSFEVPAVPAGTYEVLALPPPVPNLPSAAAVTTPTRVGTVTVTGDAPVRIADVVLRPLSGFFAIEGYADGVANSRYPMCRYACFSRRWTPPPCVWGDRPTIQPRTA